MSRVRELGYFDEIGREGDRVILRRGRLRYHVPLDLAPVFLEHITRQGVDGVSLDADEETE